MAEEVIEFKPARTHILADFDKALFLFLTSQRMPWAFTGENVGELVDRPEAVRQALTKDRRPSRPPTRLIADEEVEHTLLGQGKEKGLVMAVAFDTDLNLPELSEEIFTSSDFLRQTQRFALENKLQIYQGFSNNFHGLLGLINDKITQINPEIVRVILYCPALIRNDEAWITFRENKIPLTEELTETVISIFHKQSIPFSSIGVMVVSLENLVWRIS